MVARARRDRRVCRVLLWMGLGVVAVQVGFGLLLDRRGPLLSIRFREAAVRLEQLRTAEHPPEVVFLGSSRMEAMPANVVNRALGGQGLACNLAVGAGDLTSSAFVLEQVFQEKARPRLVVVEVLPESLHRTNHWLTMHVLRQMTWRDALVNAGELCRTGCLKRLLGTRTIPVYYYRERVLELIGTALRPTPRAQSVAPAADISASVPDIPRAQVTPARLRLGLEDYDRKWFRDYSVGGCSAEALDSLLKRCRREGCAVVLVALPLPSPHRALHTPRVETAFRSCIDELCAAYQCRFVDLRTQLPDELFQDHHHVASWGYRAYGELMTQKVVVPGWEQLNGTVPAATAKGK